MKTAIYLAILVAALLLLAAGGWAVKGLKRVVSRPPAPRFA